jgi:hypothetical protein
LRLAGASCLLAATAASGEIRQAERLTVEENGNQTLEVGLIEPCVKTNLFRIKNAGTRPLEIRRLIPTCSCVKGFTDKQTLGTNEEAVITFELNGALLADAFKRDLWVQTDDVRNPRILLSVVGTVRSLFSGLPPMPVRLVAQDARASWTNRYTLTPSDEGLVLGAPQIATNDLLMSVSVTTNRQGAKAEYVVTVVSETAQPGKASGRVLFPVSGKAGAELPPTVLTFFVTTGAELAVTPSTLLVLDSGERVSRRVRIRTSDPHPDAGKLDWSPHLKGLAVTIQPGRSTSGLSVVLELSKEALQELLRQKETKLTFTYPRHKPAVLALVASESETAANRSSDGGRP